jgi:hydrogenase-4 component E
MEGVVWTLMYLHLLASVLAAEWRNLRSATWALVVQSVTLALIFSVLGWQWNQPAMFLWAVWAVATKAVLVPYLLLRALRLFPGTEVEPLLGFRAPWALTVLLVLAISRLLFLLVGWLGPSVAAVQSGLALALTVFVLGLYVCTIRRDVIKIIIGVLLLENGAHLALAVLAPTRWETAYLGIFTNVVVAAWLLIYIARVVYEAIGTTDTLVLSQLRR